MTTAILLLLLVAPLAVAAGPVAAASWSHCAPAADCEGWHLEAEIDPGAGHAHALVDFTVTLRLAGFVVEEQSGTLEYRRTPQAAPVTFGRSWSADVDGRHEVHGVFTLRGASAGAAVRKLEAAVGCRGAGPACDRSPGWWSAHPEAWPVATLEIAGEILDREALLAVLDGPPAGAPLLVQQLIAAKLNVAAGVEDTVGDFILAADLFLSEHPRTSTLADRELGIARQLESGLRAFNWQACDGEGDGTLALAGEESPAPRVDTATDRGIIKTAYR